MEWYYTLLLVIAGFLVITAIIVYVFRSRILNWIMATILGMYIVSPLDLLPDFIPLAGWSDDIGALIFMIGFIIRGINMGRKKKEPKNIKVEEVYTDEDGILE